MLSLLLPFGSAFADLQPAVCPDSSLGETQEDCPWGGIARALSQEAQSRPLHPSDLKQAAPALYPQIERDGKLGTLKGLWGTSINYDELAKGIIIDPAILKMLAETFRVKLTDAMLADHLSHAGMEHTYGYLFSTLKTAFGYKRARWVHGDTERGFGFPVGTLGPQAPEVSGGTLFVNATWFMGHIAFREEPANLQILKRHENDVAKVLRDFDFTSLKPIRLEETIPSKGVVLRTDLVPFKVTSGDANSTVNSSLLVYSVVVGGKARLITGFPVTQTFVDNTLNKDGLGDNKPITTRYNAYIDGVTGNTFTGTRRVEKTQ